MPPRIFHLTVLKGFCSSASHPLIFYTKRVFLFSAGMEQDMNGPPDIISKLLEENAVLKQENSNYRQTGDRLQSILANIPGVAYEFFIQNNGELGLNYVSERVEEVFGLSPEKWQTLFPEFLSNIHPDDQGEFLISIRRAAETLSAWKFEGRYVKPSGEMIWFRGLSSPTKHSECIIFDGILLDITEGKREQQARKDSEEKFFSAFHGSPEAININSAEDGAYLEINEAFLRKTGFKREDVIGQTPSTLNVWVDRNTSKLYADELKSRGAVHNFEARLRIPSGEIRHFLLSTKLVTLQGKKCSLNYSVDITERKKAEDDLRESEKNLRESEEKFRMIFEFAPVPLTISDLNGRYIDVNEHMCKRTGLRREEMIGRRREDLPQSARAVNPEDETRLKVKFVRQGWIENEQLEMIRVSTNEHFTALCSGRRIELGGQPCVIAMVLDISEKKRLEEQLHHAQKMESVGRLAGGVAHDFNNMLGVILGHTDLAMRRIEPDNPLRSHLHEIQKAAERSANLTRQLLTFARRQPIAPKLLDLNETVEGMLKMLQRLIGEDIVLEWLPADGLWPVRMDPSQLDQILVNLCVNARDAISGVGRITIESANISFDEAIFTEAPYLISGDYVLLAVSDNGCGVDRKIQEKLFEPFFTTKEMGKGTGLGLATVYGIVKQNNGLIHVYSEPGQETTFRIYLPRQAGKTEIDNPEQNHTPIIKGSETVLVVEDEMALLNLTVIMLEGQGYKVLPAIAPVEALQLAEKHVHDIHLLISDVIMPNMNGPELAGKLQERFPNLKCLFVSGYTSNIIAQHGVLDQGVHFIQKPFSKKTLTDKVREVLDQK